MKVKNHSHPHKTQMDGFFEGDTDAYRYANSKAWLSRVMNVDGGARSSVRIDR